MEVVASHIEAVATQIEAVATQIETVATHMEAVATQMEAVSLPDIDSVGSESPGLGIEVLLFNWSGIIRLN
jgi:hypothetical protein